MVDMGEWVNCFSLILLIIKLFLSTNYAKIHFSMNCPFIDFLIFVLIFDTLILEAHNHSTDSPLFAAAASSMNGIATCWLECVAMPALKCLSFSWCANLKNAFQNILLKTNKLIFVHENCTFSRSKSVPDKKVPSALCGSTTAQCVPPNPACQMVDSENTQANRTGIPFAAAAASPSLNRLAVAHPHFGCCQQHQQYRDFCACHSAAFPLCYADRSANSAESVISLQAENLSKYYFYKKS